MNKLQYLNFMKKYAGKSISKKKQLHNADGTFASKKRKTINLLKYRQESKRD